MEGNAMVWKRLFEQGLLVLPREKLNQRKEGIKTLPLAKRAPLFAIVGS